MFRLSSLAQRPARAISMRPTGALHEAAARGKFELGRAYKHGLTPRRGGMPQKLFPLARAML
jgi:hypothetical protein